MTAFLVGLGYVLLVGASVAVRIVGRGNRRAARLASVAALLAGVSAITIFSGPLVGAASDGSVLGIVQAGVPDFAWGDPVAIADAQALVDAARVQVIVCASMAAVAVIALVAALVVLRRPDASASPTADQIL